MKWIKLTSAKTGRHILVNLERAVAINAHTPVSETVEGSVVSFGLVEVIVHETPDQIDAILSHSQTEPSGVDHVVSALDRLAVRLPKHQGKPEK